MNKKIIFIGPHLEPNVELNRKNIIRLLKNKIEDSTNYDLIEVDRALKNISKNNNIKYISKIDILNFNLMKDFVVNDNITFSDDDHWSEFGEIYFGNKIINNSIIKEILFD